MLDGRRYALPAHGMSKACMPYPASWFMPPIASYLKA
ncbi:hypothetical protein SAMN05444172_2426 [Burkholderia sp. GAS332]|nr:hypothetical protein SAMN05444172_2426 [Burkholderia sp. GAS332]